MSKKSNLEREFKKLRISKKYFSLRNKLLYNLKLCNNVELRRSIMFAIRSLPRNSNSNRLRKRCFLTGRARGYVGFFGLSRITLREMVSKGEIFGVIKSSW